MQRRGTALPHVWAGSSNLMGSDTAFSNIDIFFQTKNDLVLMLCLYMLHETQQKNKNPHLGHGMIWRFIQV